MTNGKEISSILIYCSASTLSFQTPVGNLNKQDLSDLTGLSWINQNACKLKKKKHRGY